MWVCYSDHIWLHLITFNHITDLDNLWCCDGGPWFTDDKFIALQQAFLSKHCNVFDESDENKLEYTAIFQQYVCGPDLSTICIVYSIDGQILLNCVLHGAVFGYSWQPEPIHWIVSVQTIKSQAAMVFHARFFTNDQVSNFKFINCCLPIIDGIATGNLVILTDCMHDYCIMM